MKHKPRHETKECGRGFARREAEACGRIGTSLRDGCKTKQETVYCNYLVSVLGACDVAEVSDPQWQAPFPPELKPCVCEGLRGPKRGGREVFVEMTEARDRGRRREATQDIHRDCGRGREAGAG